MGTLRKGVNRWQHKAQPLASQGTRPQKAGQIEYLSVAISKVEKTKSPALTTNECREENQGM